jgi:hypothetical protein
MKEVDRYSPVKDLTNALQEMAGRVRAEFVVDEQKTQTFIAAREEREKKSAIRN